MLSISPSSFGLGAIFGGGIGVFATRRFLTERLRAEIMEEAERDVESMRKHFERKEVALAERTDGRTAEQIIKERGYHEDASTVPDVRILRPPVPVRDAPLASQKAPEIKEEVEEEQESPSQKIFFPPRQSPGEWDFKKEVAGRTGTKPYIIHHSEMTELEGFETVSYTYYPVDNVLLDEDGQPITEIGMVIGDDTLSYFGHGSEDPNVVFVRNNTLRHHIEIQQLPGRSYAVDVLGLSDDDAS